MPRLAKGVVIAVLGVWWGLGLMRLEHALLVFCVGGLAGREDNLIWSCLLFFL